MKELWDALYKAVQEMGLLKVALMALLAFIGLNAYEHREQVWAAMMSSNTSLYVLGVGTLLIGIGLFVSGLLKRIEKATEIRINDLKEQISDLKEELKHCEDKCREETREAHEAMQVVLERIERTLDK